MMVFYHLHHAKRLKLLDDEFLKSVQKQEKLMQKGIFFYPSLHSFIYFF